MAQFQHTVASIAELAAIRPGYQFDIPSTWTTTEPLKLTVERVTPPLLHTPTSLWVGARDQHRRFHDVYVDCRLP